MAIIQLHLQLHPADRHPQNSFVRRYPCPPSATTAVPSHLWYPTHADVVPTTSFSMVVPEARRRQANHFSCNHGPRRTPATGQPYVHFTTALAEAIPSKRTSATLRHPPPPSATLRHLWPPTHADVGPTTSPPIHSSHFIQGIEAYMVVNSHVNELTHSFSTVGSQIDFTYELPCTTDPRSCSRATYRNNA